MQANLNETDSAILKSVAAWVGMEPGDFLKLAGLGLVDALSGLYTVMAKDPYLRNQVRELVELRQKSLIDDFELAQELAELAGMPRDAAWTDEEELCDC